VIEEKDKNNKMEGGESQQLQELLQSTHIRELLPERQIVSAKNSATVGEALEVHFSHFPHLFLIHNQKSHHVELHLTTSLVRTPVVDEAPHFVHAR
jgi:hypothetical protein